MKDNLEIGNRIRKIRTELKMSRNVFSENIGISESYLAQLELGNKALGMNTLISLCEYTGFSSDYILFGSEDEQELSKKVNRIVYHLPENSLILSYEILRSIKAFSNK